MRVTSETQASLAGMWPSPTSFLSGSWRGGLLASGPGRGYSFDIRETKGLICELETSIEDPPSFYFFFPAVVDLLQVRLSGGSGLEELRKR